jgi:hypothetical protein
MKKEIKRTGDLAPRGVKSTLEELTGSMKYFNTYLLKQEDQTKHGNTTKYIRTLG